MFYKHLERVAWHVEWHYLARHSLMLSYLQYLIIALTFGKLNGSGGTTNFPLYIQYCAPNNDWYHLASRQLKLYLHLYAQYESYQMKVVLITALKLSCGQSRYPIFPFALILSIAASLSQLVSGRKQRDISRNRPVFVYKIIIPNPASLPANDLQTIYLNELFDSTSFFFHLIINTLSRWDLITSKNLFRVCCLPACSWLLLMLNQTWICSQPFKMMEEKTLHSFVPLVVHHITIGFSVLVMSLA